MFMFLSVQSVQAVWWNSSWNYSRQINVTSTSEDLTDFQVRIKLNLTDAYNDGKLQDDCDDIRFVDSTNNELDFYTAYCNIIGENSIFWVKLNLTKDVTKTIYMYYGNPEVSSASNYSALFEPLLIFLAEDTNVHKVTVLNMTNNSIDSRNCPQRILTGSIDYADDIEYLYIASYGASNVYRIKVNSSGFSGSFIALSGNNDGSDQGMHYSEEKDQYWVGSYDGGDRVYRYDADGSNQFIYDVCNWDHPRHVYFNDYENKLYVGRNDGTDIAIARCNYDDTNCEYSSSSVSGRHDLYSHEDGTISFIRQSDYSTNGVHHSNWDFTNDSYIGGYSHDFDYDPVTEKYYVLNLSGSPDHVYCQRMDGSGYENIALDSNYYRSIAISERGRKFTNPSPDYIVGLEIEFEDTIPPEITVISPKNVTYGSSILDFNVSLNEDGDWCGFSYDGQTNTTMTKYNNTYFTYTKTPISEGQHNITYWCNDTAGNMNSTSIYFSIEYCNPVSYDWDISTDIICEDKNITLSEDSNINIFNGSLTLINSSVWLNVSGKVKITVYSNGSINITNSSIDSLNDRYSFIVNETSNFSMVNSNISRCYNIEIYTTVDKFTNNYIYDSYTGVSFYNSDNNTISHNTIKKFKNEGMYFYNSNNNNISYNIIEYVYNPDWSTTDSSFIHIRYSNNNGLFGNIMYSDETNINLYSRMVWNGIFVDNSNYNTIINNHLSNVHVYTTRIYYSDNTTIRNHVVNNTYGDGIILSNSNYCNITNYTVNTFEFGLYCAGQYNRIENMHATNGSQLAGSGIRIDRSNNYFRNITVEDSNRGFDIWARGETSHTDNNTLIDIRLINNTDGIEFNRGISKGTVKDNIIIDGIIDSKEHDIISQTTGYVNNTFLNVTFNKSSTIITNGVITVKWYFDCRVISFLNHPLENANVTITNNKDIMVFNGLTDSNGYIQRQNLTEYIENSSGKFYDTNYTIYVTKSKYKPYNSEFNLTTNTQLTIRMQIIKIIECIDNETLMSKTYYTHNIDGKTITDVREEYIKCRNGCLNNECVIGKQNSSLILLVVAVFIFIMSSIVL